VLQPLDELIDSSTCWAGFLVRLRLAQIMNVKIARSLAGLAPPGVFLVLFDDTKMGARLIHTSRAGAYSMRYPV
jgi:hypothetical protein